MQTALNFAAGRFCCTITLIWLSSSVSVVDCFILLPFIILSFPSAPLAECMPPSIQSILESSHRSLQCLHYRNTPLFQCIYYLNNDFAAMPSLSYVNKAISMYVSLNNFHFMYFNFSHLLVYM